MTYRSLIKKLQRMSGDALDQEITIQFNDELFALKKVWLSTFPYAVRDRDTDASSAVKANTPILVAN